jgi:hypothetical protein
LEKIDQAKLLAHLPPHLRAKMLKRVEVLRRYARDKSRENAERGAAELDLSLVHFKKLAHVWELHGRADRLPGSEWPKTKSVATTDEQIGIMRKAIDEVPTGTVARIVRRAIEIAAARGVEMPSRNTIHARITEIRGCALQAGTIGSDCDLVVVHAALNVPVEIDGAATMPIAALAVHPATRTVLGIGLSGSGVEARSAASALAMALDRLPMSSATAASDGPLRIALDTLPGVDWMTLRTALEQARAAVEGEARELPRRDIAMSYLGRKVGGIEVRPRLTMKPPADRTPYIASGQSCVTLAEALEFVTIRMVPEVRPSARGNAASRLLDGISQWLNQVEGA